MFLFAYCFFNYTAKKRPRCACGNRQLNPGLFKFLGSYGRWLAANFVVKDGPFSRSTLALQTQIRAQDLINLKSSFCNRCSCRIAGFASSRRLPRALGTFILAGKVVANRSLLRHFMERITSQAIVVSSFSRSRFVTSPVGLLLEIEAIYLIAHWSKSFSFSILCVHWPWPKFLASENFQLWVY